MVNQIEEDGLEDFLTLSLANICNSVRATWCVLLDFNGQQLVELSSCSWQGGVGSLTPEDLKADDVLHLEPETLPPPFTEAALLLPLLGDAEQFGAIVLGRPVNSAKYSFTDVERLLYPSDQIAEAIYRSRQEVESFEKAAEISTQFEPQQVIQRGQIAVKEVEQALKHIQ